jgi:hypothetical protein
MEGFAMSDTQSLEHMAAEKWATFNVSLHKDPVEFGHRVALAALAAKVTWSHRGDEKATAAAIAALSVPGEALQLLSQVSALLSRPVEPLGGSQKTTSAGE